MKPAPRNAVGNLYGIRGDIEHDTTRQLLNKYTPAGVQGVTYGEDGEGKETMIIKKEYTVELRRGGTVNILISGRADGEIAYDADNPDDLALLEVKTTGFYPYDWLSKAYEAGYKTADGTKVPGGHGAALARIKEKHKSWYAQCQMTMGITGHTKCYLLVVDRSSGTMGLHNKTTDKREGIIFDFDQEFFDDLLQKFASIKYKLNVDEAPIAEFAEKSTECSYCPFKYRCHDAVNRRRKGLEPAVVYPGPQTEEPIESTNQPADSGDQRQDAQRQVDSSKSSGR